MINKKTTIFAATLLGLGLSGAASATTIDYASQTGPDGMPMSAVQGVTTVNFNDGQCGYISCGDNYRIATGSVSGRYGAPSYSDGNGGTVRDTTPYLSVPDDLSGGTSTDVALGTTANYFGLLWGSIDSYNTLSFLLDGQVVDSYNGMDITTPNSANGDQAAPSTNTYVNFYDLPTFDGVRFTSGSYAFESDNHAYGTISDVPEPGNLALFALAGLGMLVAFRRRLSGGAF